LPSIRDKDLKLRFLRMMLRIRRSQEILMEEYHPADEMRCPMHFCIGQEATPTALSEVLKPSDFLYSHHRSHGYYMARKAPLADMVAEFYGKASGASGGLAGSQELSHGEFKFYSGAILSGAFVLAVGSAFAASYTGSDAIAIGVLGDGGMEEGVVFESLNLAAVKSLPILFICENNGFSVQTPLNVRSTAQVISERVQAFGVNASSIDGNDVFAIYEKLKEITAEMRTNPAPYFLEIETYRTCGHVGPEGDDHYDYRPQSEIEEWRQRDPLSLLRGTLSSDDIKEPDVKRMTEEVDTEIWAAIDAAKAAPFPEFETALASNMSDDYSPIVDKLIEGPVGNFDPTQLESRPGPF
ncbi:MAG: thiamine pyrophosphate-dependent dehydrogenase E1 component subunit alpha, partial [Rhodospirillales bacterium]|nr:thiamine pyrophosphate-dependent dehydrogenase E1 component subunit alpha [Rhodospirillales bacterium]